MYATYMKAWSSLNNLLGSHWEIAPTFLITSVTIFSNGPFSLSSFSLCHVQYWLLLLDSRRHHYQCSRNGVGCFGHLVLLPPAQRLPQEQPWGSTQWTPLGQSCAVGSWSTTNGRWEILNVDFCRKGYISLEKLLLQRVCTCTMRGRLIYPFPLFDSLKLK